MNLYRVTTPDNSWTTSAKSIAHMSAFLRHCPVVRVRKVRSLIHACVVIHDAMRAPDTGVRTSSR
jgi:hypothetical protein